MHSIPIGLAQMDANRDLRSRRTTIVPLFALTAIAVVFVVPRSTPIKSILVALRQDHGGDSLPNRVTMRIKLYSPAPFYFEADGCPTPWGRRTARHRPGTSFHVVGSETQPTSRITPVIGLYETCLVRCWR